MNIKCLDTLLVVYIGAYRMLYIYMYVYIYTVLRILYHRQSTLPLYEQSFVLHLDLVLLFVS